MESKEDYTDIEVQGISGWIPVLRVPVSIFVEQPPNAFFFPSLGYDISYYQHLHGRWKKH